MIRFLVDAQLPPALARWLGERGFHAEHVSDLLLTASTDRELWDYALRHGAAIVTKDEDFATRRLAEETGPTIVWIRLGNTSRREILAWFATVLTNVVEALERGEAVVEIT